MGFILENFGYRVTLINGGELLIEGHKGITEYLEGALSVRIRGGKLLVTGEDLTVKEINEQELLLVGKVDRVEVVR